MHVDDPLAGFTAHVTTPMKFTVTPLFEFPFEGVVPAATAHQATSIHALWVSIALATHRAERARFEVADAVVWRLIQVGQVFVGGLVVFLVPADEFGATLVELDLRGSVVAVTQTIADLPERRKSLPASLHCAWTGNAVALASDLGVVVYGLWVGIKRKKRKKWNKFNMTEWVSEW